MLSFTGLKLQCANLTQDTSTGADTFFGTNINIGLGILESELGSFYTEETSTINTIASTSIYKTPANCVRIKSLYITIGTQRYLIHEVFEEDEWNMYKRSTQTSDVLTRFFYTRDNFEVFPTPTTSSLVMSIKYEAGGTELTAADYTTGTITTIANGATALTASGTTFTTAMAGRYIYLPDGNWYKIASYGSATTLTLDKAYEGISIAAGSSTFTIGQLPRLPSPTQHIPALYAVWQYYRGFKQNTEKGNEYKSEYEQALMMAKKTYSRRYSTRYLPGRRIFRFPLNYNNYPTGMT